MLPSAIKVNIIAAFIFLLVVFANGQDRKVNSTLNPGCKDCGSLSTLVYVKASSDSDTIHQIWDFTQGIPTMILTVAGINSSIEIGWDGEKPNNFTLSEKAQYSFAIAIDKLHEYNDLEDNGRMDAKNPQREILLNNVTWQLQNSVFTDKESMVRMQGFLNYNETQKDIIDMQLVLLPYKDYAMELPHMIHNANSSLVDISLVNLTTSLDYKASRFAINLLLVSTESGSDTMHQVFRKSFDDEHTPGIFEIVEIKAPSAYERDMGGFMQFRPVSYNQPERNIASSTLAYLSSFNRTFLPHESTLDYFYRQFEAEHLLVQDMIISFGESGDGFYKQRNYSEWSYMFGYGTPPREKFSLLVMLIICIGVTVPLVMALSGMACLIAKSCREGNNPFQLTNEE